MAREKMQPDGEDFFIYGEPANINFFVKTALESVSVGSVVDKTSTVKAHTRRKYVGDTAPSNVSGFTREFMYDPGRTSGNALPGSPFILIGGGETRQFTLQGDIKDLHSYLVGDAKIDLKLISNEGGKYTIKVAAGGG